MSAGKNLYSESKNMNEKNINYQQLINKYYKLEKNIHDINTAYFTNKIFSQIAIKDQDFNNETLKVEKFRNRLLREFKNLNNDIRLLEYRDDLTEDKYLDIADKLKNIAYFQDSIKNSLEQINRKYFAHLKIATLNICMNKNNREIETLYKSFKDYLQDFKNLTEAADYIYFNSGQLILATVDTLISSISNETYDVNYFLPSNVIITLELKEWIDLYNKLRFVIKKEKVVNQSLDQYYKEFELRYLLLMMNMEINNNQIKNFKI